MPYLTRNEIEAIAQRVTTAYKKLPANQGRPLTRIDPDQLATDLLGLTVEYHTLSQTGSVHGLTAFGEVLVPVYDDPNYPSDCLLDGKTILIEKSLMEDHARIGRWHFTVSHEASHQIYRMLFPKAYQTAIHCRTVHYYTSTAPPGDWEEWRTNALAAAILMPADILQANMENLGLEEKLPFLRRRDKYFEKFLRLSGVMEVSTQALAIRMKQLGFLERYYLGNPDDLITAVAGDDETDKWRK